MQTESIGPDGSFHFFFLPEGEYKIAVHQPNGGVGKWWFYPAGQNYYDAGTVRVERGKVTGGLKLVVIPGSLH